MGPRDQKSAKNRITSKKIIQASNLISLGEIYELEQHYEEAMPLRGRPFTQHLISPPPIDASNKTSLIANRGMFTGELGQVGKQFDALGHIGFRKETEDYYYNAIPEF